jgi:uncharacterized protein (DUF1697 family)
MDPSTKPTTYVALLRGINVGGRNVIKMADLRATFEELGFSDVRTHIQSGNVVFRSSDADKLSPEAAIEEGLSRAHGYAAKIVLRTLAEYNEMLAAFPPAWGSDPTRKHNVIFLRASIDRESLIDDLEPRPGIEEVHYVRGALLWSADIATLTRSRMIKLAARAEYQEMTIRNLNTTTKLFALMQAVDRE